MTNPSNVPPDNPSEDKLDSAIAVVCSIPVPDGAIQRTIDIASGWETASPPVPLKPRWWVPRPIAAALMLSALVAAMVVVAFVGVGFFWVYRVAEHRSQPQAQLGTDTPSDGQVFHEPGPMTRPAWAESASILVTIGPEKPVKLGAVVKHKDNEQGLEPGKVRLHAWDWSKSDLSRILVAKRSQVGVLSADGTMMISATGEETNLATGVVRKHTGFSVKEGQRMTALRFSPLRTYVAGTVHVGSQTEKTQVDPPVFSTTHYWSQRIVNLETGKSMGEFPAQADAGIAFTPDETSFIYSTADHNITRRDVKTGKVLNEYQPTLGIHGAVGISISLDGRFVAAGHYHGKLYVWDVQSGMLVLQYQFLRDDGDHDTFFQAKVMEFSPDGKFLAIASGSRLKVMEMKTGAIIASHSHEATPNFVHLRWLQDGKKISLLTYSDATDFTGDDRFPPRGTADVLPRVYEWDWKDRGPVLKKF